MDDWIPPGVEASSDVTAAAWIVQQLKPWDVAAARLPSFAPAGYQAYARILNPARPVLVADQHPYVGVRWADLARSSGAELRPDISFGEVLLGNRPWDYDEVDEAAPISGGLWPNACRALGPLLGPHTGTPEQCWFCVWDGYGYEQEAPDPDFLVKTEHRSYVLLTGPLTAACEFDPSGTFPHLSPNLWWPQDRAWVVVTEIDGVSTYVGGPKQMIDEICASTQIEAIEVPFDVRMCVGTFRPRWL